jgi:RNA polymerase sigma factor (TIGR02999 family)
MSAGSELLPLVYDELRRLAAQKLANETPGQTLQPTALVHEAWLRLFRVPDQTWQNRTHFFRTAAECMRRILIDVAVAKGRSATAAARSVLPMIASSIKFFGAWNPDENLHASVRLAGGSSALSWTIF